MSQKVSSLSELFNLPPEEKEKIFLEVIDKAIKEQLRLLNSKDEEEKQNE